MTLVIIIIIVGIVIFVLSQDRKAKSEFKKNAKEASKLMRSTNEGKELISITSGKIEKLFKDLYREETTYKKHIKELTLIYFLPKNSHSGNLVILNGISNSWTVYEDVLSENWLIIQQINSRDGLWNFMNSKFEVVGYCMSEDLSSRVRQKMK